MANLSTKRVAEMLSDLEDYELQWDGFETEFITGMKDRLEENEDTFQLIGKQQATLERIYNKYCKRPS